MVALINDLLTDLLTYECMVVAAVAGSSHCDTQRPPTQKRQLTADDDAKVTRRLRDFNTWQRHRNFWDVHLGQPTQSELAGLHQDLDGDETRSETSDGCLSRCDDVDQTVVAYWSRSSPWRATTRVSSTVYRTYKSRPSTDTANNVGNTAERCNLLRSLRQKWPHPVKDWVNQATSRSSSWSSSSSSSS